MTDPTLATDVFVNKYSDLSGSLYQNFDRGASIPDRLLIRATDIIDQATKLPAIATSVRFERLIALSDGRIAIGSSATLRVVSLKDANVTSTVILGPLGYMEQLVAAAANTNGLNKKEDIFVNGVQ